MHPEVFISFYFQAEIIGQIINDILSKRISFIKNGLIISISAVLNTSHENIRLNSLVSGYVEYKFLLYSLEFLDILKIKHARQKLRIILTNNYIPFIRKTNNET